MRTETPCPVCRQPVTLGAFMGASTPSRIRCKNCRYRLRPGPGATPVIMIILLIAGLIAFVLGFGLTFLYLDGQIPLFIAIMILMIVALPLIIASEVIFYLYVCNKSGLVVNERQ